MVYVEVDWPGEQYLTDGGLTLLQLYGEQRQAGTALCISMQFRVILAHSIAVAERAAVPTPRSCGCSLAPKFQLVIDAAHTPSCWLSFTNLVDFPANSTVLGLERRASVN